MPQCTIHRNACQADRLNAIDAAAVLWFRGMPAIALVLVLVLLISHGGAG